MLYSSGRCCGSFVDADGTMVLGVAYHWLNPFRLHKRSGTSAVALPGEDRNNTGEMVKHAGNSDGYTGFEERSFRTAG